MTVLENKSNVSGEVVYTGEAPFVDGCSLYYQLYRRKNTDTDIEAVWLYDLSVTKRKGSEILDHAQLRAVSSVYLDAVRLCETAIGWGISPISVYDFYEEYVTR